MQKFEKISAFILLNKGKNDIMGSEVAKAISCVKKGTQEYDL